VVLGALKRLIVEYLREDDRVDPMSGNLERRELGRSQQCLRAATCGNDL
jgi:hypothetical protein